MKINGENQQKLITFLNCCRSASKAKIAFEQLAQVRSARDFQLYTDSDRIEFLLNRVSFFDFDDKREYRLKPGNTVFSYHFILKREILGILKTIGYLAFYEGKPPGENKIKWIVKSLEKDDSDKDKADRLVLTAQEFLLEGSKNETADDLP